MKTLCTYGIFDRDLYDGDRPTREALIGVAIVPSREAAGRLLNGLEVGLDARRVELKSSSSLGKERRGWLEEFGENSRDG